MRYTFLASVFLFTVLIAGFAFTQDQGKGIKDPANELQKIQQAIETKGANWTAGVNDIFLLSPQEKKRLCGDNGTISLERIPETEQVMRYAWHPEKFDWRSVDGSNWMTSVKNQGACGSCVAFATIGTLEGQLNIYNDNPNLNMDLSEAHIYFCAGRTCDEGWTSGDAFQYLLENGAPDEDCLPYTAGDRGDDQNCADGCSDWRDRAVHISCWGWVGGNDEVRTPAQIKEQLLKGPVATSMTVFEDFDAYTRGIYEHVEGEERGGHCVVFVGWDDTTDPPCWIVKNSWGLWGEGGYFRIRMGTNEVGIEGRNVYLTMGDVAEGEVSDNGHLYGNVDVGDSEDWILYITNVGAADLEIYGFSADTSMSAFYVTPPSDYPQTIATGDTLSYIVTFAPDTVGFQYVRMHVLSNSCRLLPDLKLRGTGLIHNVKAEPKSIEETMDQGEVATVPLTVMYKGEAILNITVEVLRDWLSVEPEGGTIEAGGSAEFTVTFDTSDLEAGAYRTNILIKTDDPTDKVVVVPVTLSVMEAAGVAVTVPSTANPIDQAIDLKLYIDNASNIEMPIMDASIRLGYDAALLDLHDIVPTPRLESMRSFIWNESEPGMVTISISDGNGNTIAPGTEAIAALSFTFLEGTSCGDSARIEVTDIALTDTTGILLDVKISDGLILALCKGDVNADGILEITDVIEAVQYLLQQACTEDWTMGCWAADYNDDETIDILDLIGMINVILGRGGTR